MALRWFWTCVWLAVLLASIFQLVSFPDRDNLICVGAVITGCALLTFGFRQQMTFVFFPFSSLAVLGYGLCRLVFPLIFISLDKKPVTYSLFVPLQTYPAILLMTAVFLTAHGVYRSSSIMFRIRNWVARKPLTTLGIYATPSEAQLWSIGGIGLVALMYMAFFSGAFQTDDASVELHSSPLTKFIDGFKVFCYLPFLAVFPALYGGTIGRGQSMRWIRAGIFFGLILVTSLAANNRSAFMAIILELGMVYLLGILLGCIPLRISPTQLVMILFGAILIHGPLKDLSNAMVIVRGSKTSQSATELVELTIQTFFDKKALAAIGDVDENYETISSINYFDSPFLNRFCNVKMTDTSLYLVGQIGEAGQKVMRQTWKDHFLITYPAPLIKLLHIPINKEAVDKASYGDILVVLVTGNMQQLGSWATSDFIGVDYAVFGLWFLLVEFLFALAIFILVDSLAMPPDRVVVAPQPPGGSGPPGPVTAFGLPKLSILGLLYVALYFGILKDQESSQLWGSYMVRYWEQSIILYAIIFRITSVLKVQG